MPSVKSKKSLLYLTGAADIKDARVESKSRVGISFICVFVGVIVFIIREGCERSLTSFMELIAWVNKPCFVHEILLQIPCSKG